MTLEPLEPRISPFIFHGFASYFIHRPPVHPPSTLQAHTTPPAIAIHPTPTRETLYTSWNHQLTTALAAHNPVAVNRLFTLPTLSIFVL